MMESPQSVVPSVLFAHLIDPAQKSRVILLFSQIVDSYDAVSNKAAWNLFMDSVQSPIPAQDSVLQYLQSHCQNWRYLQIRSVPASNTVSPSQQYSLQTIKPAMHDPASKTASR